MDQGYIPHGFHIEFMIGNYILQVWNGNEEMPCVSTSMYILQGRGFELHKHDVGFNHFFFGIISFCGNFEKAMFEKWLLELSKLEIISFVDFSQY